MSEQPTKAIEAHHPVFDGLRTQEPRPWLRARGFQDREHQVFLECVRRWGGL